MKDRDSKKLFIMIMCICLSIFGLYMQFFREKKVETKVETSTNIKADNREYQKETEIMSQDPNDFLKQDLPNVENDSVNETYTDGQLVDVYFSNTEVLDTGNLPLAAQKVLSGETQKFLYRNGYEDVTELYVDSDSYKETKENIVFNCFMDGHEEMLQVLFQFDESKIKLYILTVDGSTVNDSTGGDDAEE